MDMNDQIGAGVERDRRGDAILSELLTTSREMNVTIQKVNGTLRSHMHDYEMNHRVLRSMMASLEDQLKAVTHGFPDDDPLSHRAIHEAQIAKIQNMAEFWRKMTFELAKWGLIGFIGWAAWSLWLAFLHGPKQ